MSKKFLAKLLIFCMIFTMLPVSAFAAEPKAAETHVYTIGADVDPTVALGGTATITLGTYTVDTDITTYPITKLDGTPKVNWTVKDGSTGAVTVSDNTVTATKAGNVTLTGTVTGVTVPVGTTVAVKDVALTVTEKDPDSFTVNVATATNGTVTADKTTAKVGDTVTLTVNPNAGYKLDKVVVTANDGGNVNLAADGKSFVMPGADVTVTATFVEDKTVPGVTTYSVEINSANNVEWLTGSTKTATLTAVLRENETIKEIAAINKDAVLTWSVEPEDVVTLSANGRKATVTAKEVKEETKVVVAAVLTVPETKEVTDKDGKVTVEVVKDDKGNTVMKELARASYVLYVDPATYTIAMKENSRMELLVNGTEAERTKAMEVVVKADGKEITMPISWTSSNDKVATVDYKGNVTAVGYGEATITATLSGSSVKATRTVKVAYKPVTVTFNAGEGKFAEGVADKDGVVKLTTNEQGKLSKLADAPTRDEYKFMGWGFADASKPVTTDVIYANDTELQAMWVKIEPLKAVATTDGATQTVKVTGTFNGAGTKTEGSAEATKTTATFNVVTKIGDNIDDSITNVVVNIDPITAATLKDAKTVDFITNVATITLGDVAVQDLAEAGFAAGAGQNITLTAVKKDNNSVTNSALQEKIKATYDFALKLSRSNVINSTKANITVKFAAPEGIEDNAYVYFVNNGVLKDMHAKLSGKTITMTTNHFSEYVVAAEALVYNITFKSGKGEGEDVTTDVQITPNDKDGNKVPTEYTLPTVKELGFYKSGATFDHWSNGGNEYADGATIKVSGDMTLTAVWKDDKTGDVISGGGSIGGGGGGSSSNVSVATNVTGGKVTVSPSRPTRGQTVTLNAKPADGYKLDTITVTDNKGNAVELTKISDNKYTFTMPAGKITVTPAFVKVDGTDKKDDENKTNVDKRFSDVAADAWYAEYINYVAENGLMNGYEDGRFGPNDKTTRAQIVTVLYRMEGEPAVQNANSFKDVSAGGQYYSSAVAWAARNNIVNGYEDGRFGPNDNVTREQIAAILYRYAAYKQFDTTVTGSISNFSDAAKVSSWAKTAIGWAVGEGLMNGDNGALRPQGNATRAEIAALLMRYSENIAK